MWLQLLILLSTIALSKGCDDKPNNNTNSQQLVSWLLSNKNLCEPVSRTYSTFNGYNHNFAEPQSGSEGQQVLGHWMPIQSNLYLQNITKWPELYKSLRLELCSEKHHLNYLLLGRQVADEILNSGNSSCTVLYSDPPVEINYASSFIDGSIIYGNPKHLSIQNDGTVTVKINEDADVASNKLRNTWIKLHNILAMDLKKNCSWTSDKIFNEARKFTVAVQQRVYAYDWLDNWTGTSLKKFVRYDPFVETHIGKISQGALNLLQSIKFASCNKDCLDQFTQEEWQFITASRNSSNVFTWTPGSEIYVGYPDINHVRRTYNLPTYSNWNNFSIYKSLMTNLESLTNKDLKVVDFVMGVMTEIHNSKRDLFNEVIVDQIRRIRDGDRLWYENLQNGFFSKEEICKINMLKFSDVLLITGVINHTNSTGNKQPTWYNPKKTNAPLTKETDKKIVILVSIISGYCIALLTFALSVVLIRKSVAKQQKSRENKAIRENIREKWQNSGPVFLVEVLDANQNSERRVAIVLDKTFKKIIVRSTTGTIRHTICSQEKHFEIELVTITAQPIIIFKQELGCDQVELNQFKQEVEDFLTEIMKQPRPLLSTTSWKKALESVYLNRKHQEALKRVLRVVFAQTFNIDHSLEEILNIDSIQASKVLHIKLTETDFADYLHMNVHDEFIKTMFSLIDRYETSYISFRQFLDFFIIFSNGSKEGKACNLFKTYDIDGTEELSLAELKCMLNSYLDLTDNRQNADSLLNGNSSENWDFGDFKRIVSYDFSNLPVLGLNSRRDKSFMTVASHNIESMYRNDPATSTSKSLTISGDDVILRTKKNKAHKSLAIMLIFLSYTLTLLLTFALFGYKTYGFYQESHTIWFKETLAVAKGATPCIILCYTFMLLSMCKHTLGGVKVSCLNHQKVHNLMGYLLLVFIVIHVVGHAHIFINMIHIFDQKACQVKNTDAVIDTILQFKYLSPMLVTGVVMIFLLLPLYLFAQPCMRIQSYAIFYWTHYLHFLITPLLFAHAWISKESLTFAILPWILLLLIMDRLAEKNNKKFATVTEIECLQSDGLCLHIDRPADFLFNLGQSARVSFKQMQYSSFIISSAPSQKHLRFYIPATHPVAQQVRAHIEVPAAQIKILVEGPHGDNPVRRWREYEVSVLEVVENDVEIIVPVLMDLMDVMKDNLKIRCKKVYLIWTSDNHHMHEYVTDIIRDLESLDVRQMFCATFFITSPYDNYDIRTLFLYLTETEYPRINGKNILTGLRGETLFGTPNKSVILAKIGFTEKCDSFGIFTSTPQDWGLDHNDGSSQKYTFFNIRNTC